MLLADTFTGLAGAQIIGGRPLILPSWLVNKPINEWFPIVGTNNISITYPMLDKGGLVVIGKKLYSSLVGGGNGTQANRTITMDLSLGSPTWSIILPDSVSPTSNTSHNPDGRPSSRHNNHSMAYSAAVNRIMYIGARYVYPGAVSFQNVDGLNISVDPPVWDAANTWQQVPVPGAYGVVIDCDGHFWVQNGMYRFKPETNTWDSPITSATATAVRKPYACDSSRRVVFGLCWADDEGSGNAVVNALKWSIDGNSSQTVTFNASAAYTQFQTDLPYRASMVYVPELDKYLFFNGQAGQEGRIFVITPNAGTVWDMAILTQGAGTMAVTTVPPVGVNQRFVYVSALKSLIVLPDPHLEQPIYAMRLV